MNILFYTTLFAGFRRGELVALTWEDVDFKNNTIDISKASARTRQGIITKEPKSVTSNRLVTLPAEVMEMLQMWKDEQDTYRISLGSYWHGRKYVFTQDDGRQLDISTPNKVFKKILRRYNKSHEVFIAPGSARSPNIHQIGFSAFSFHVSRQIKMPRNPPGLLSR